jgi:hypothetical protein
MQLASFKHSWSYNFEVSPRYLETSCKAGLCKLRIILNTVHTKSKVANVKAGSTDNNQCASEVSQTRHVKHRRTMFLVLTIQPVLRVLLINTADARQCTRLDRTKAARDAQLLTRRA